MTSPTFTLGEEVKRRSNRENQGLHLQILGVTLLIALLLSAAATWLCHSCSSSRCQVSPPPPLPPDLPTGSAAPQQPCSAWSIWLYKPFLGSAGIGNFTCSVMVSQFFFCLPVNAQRRYQRVYLLFTAERRNWETHVTDQILYIIDGCRNVEIFHIHFNKNIPLTAPLMLENVFSYYKQCHAIGLTAHYSETPIAPTGLKAH